MIAMLLMIAIVLMKVEVVTVKAMSTAKRLNWTVA